MMVEGLFNIPKLRIQRKIHLHFYLGKIPLRKHPSRILHADTGKESIEDESILLTVLTDHQSTPKKDRE